MLFSTAEVPSAKARLAPDETIINPYYMKQLLEYGIKLGQQAQSGDIDQEYLAKEAEVGFDLLCVHNKNAKMHTSALGSRTQGPRVMMPSTQVLMRLSISQYRIGTLYSSAQSSFIASPRLCMCPNLQKQFSERLVCTSTLCSPPCTSRSRLSLGFPSPHSNS